MQRVFILMLTLLWGALAAGEGNPQSFEVLSKSPKEIIVKVSVHDFELKAIKQDNDLLGYVPDIEEGAKHVEKGNPDLQHLTTSLIVDGQKPDIQIIDKKVKTFSNVDILPSKGNLYRNQDPDNIPYQKGDVYSSDKAFPAEIVSFGKDYQFREFKGLPLQVTPMQYHPVSKEFKLFTSITLKITFPDNPLNSVKRVSREFSSLYEKQFINYTSSRYQPLDEEGEMLVFTHQDFVQAIKPFVKWKNEIGIPAKLIRIDTVGNGSAQDIKNYISNYYQNHNLTFVLLVGDDAYVPTHNLTAGHSDNAYGYLEGNDSYPEVITGRFSAEDTQHVHTMVERTIAYESGLPNSSDWMNTSLGLSSDQGPGDNNEMDYEHIRNLHTDLQGYTYIELLEMFDGSQGGDDDPGNPTASMVSQSVNDGLGNILYTGHGSTTSWSSSGFSNSDIDQLTNTEMWPFIWSVACINGDFVGNTSFAESWTRATNNNGEPTGAIATLMSTINQSWDPPMHAQDEIVDILVESYSKNIKRTFGGLSMNGCMKMNDAYGSEGEEMTDTWNLFGDPSFMVRTDTSQTISVNSIPALFIGDTSITLDASVDDARVALSLDGKLIDVQYIDNGSATLTFPAFSNPDTMDLALVAYNHDIYFDQVPVMPASGPYVTFLNSSVDDSMGNNDQGADQGENIALDVKLENIGLDNAQGVSANLSSTDTNVVITDSSASWGSIPSKDTALNNGAYELSVKKGVENGYMVDMELEITDSNGNQWTEKFKLPIEAPEPMVSSFKVEDDSLGNGDGRLNAGEKANIVLDVDNTGLDELSYAWCTLLSSSVYVDVKKPFESIQNLAEKQKEELAFLVEVDTAIPDGTAVRFDLDIDAGNYSSVDSSYEVIGNINEDFETKDFDQFSWDVGSNYGWEIDTTEAYAGEAAAASGLPYDEHGGVSMLSISLNTVKDDSISFYRKVSSEADYDYLRFFIDGKLEEEWSGLLSWERFSYFVPAGNHVFKWTYEKDQYVSSGADKAWIDDVRFPAISTPASVDENLLVTEIHVYPNPAERIQTMELTLSKSAEVIVDLVDKTGKKIRNVKTGSMSGGKHKISYNLSGLSHGLYLLNIKVDGKQHTIKVMH
ncbi:MAG: C25 family cysteine peptidase [Bacteroidales bacterium]